jgi:hypothetical protein
VEVKLSLWLGFNSFDTKSGIINNIYVSWEGDGGDKIFNLSRNENSREISATKMK